MADPNLGVTLIDYDPSGQPSRITDQINRITTFGYDIDGQLIWLQDPNHSADTGSDVRAYRTYFDFDSFHRLGRQSAPKSTQVDRGRIIWSSSLAGAEFGGSGRGDEVWGAIGAGIVGIALGLLIVKVITKPGS